MKVSDTLACADGERASEACKSLILKGVGSANGVHIK